MYEKRLVRTDHMRGWVDCMLKCRPPEKESADYIEGFRAGVRHRIKDVQDRLNFQGRVVINDPGIATI